MMDVMSSNKDVYLIFAGLGYPRVDEFLKEFPDRAFNFEANEQTCLDACVGLSYSGKIPFVYTITPFLLRGFETIRTYLNHEKLACCLVGAGVGNEYSKTDGYSHDAQDIGKIMDTQENFYQFYPQDRDEMEEAILEAIDNKSPNFINLHR